MTTMGGRLESEDDWFVIAEIGVNHGNSMELAKEMVKQAAAGGASAAKFQTYKASKLAIRDSPAYWDTSKEPAENQHELFSRFDHFEQPDYAELAQVAKEHGIEFMSTAFDLDSLEWIDPLVGMHKIASADITNIPLIRAIAAKGKPVCLSTGAAAYSEIENAVGELRAGGVNDITIMHCVLNYPCDDRNAFLGRITELAERFPGVVLGYSDHTIPDTESTATLSAYLLGARIIEKHFTHDRSLQGNDHYHAMDLESLSALTKRLDQLKVMKKSPSEEEFLSAQAAAIRHARRSIVTSRPVKAGEVLDSENLTTKRPAAGLSPLHWDEILGKTCKHDLGEDALISFEDVE